MRTKRFHIGSALLLTLGLIVVGSLLVHWREFGGGIRDGYQEGAAPSPMIERP